MKTKKIKKKLSIIILLALLLGLGFIIWLQAKKAPLALLTSSTNEPEELKPQSKSESNSDIALDNLKESIGSNQPDEGNVAVNVENFYVAVGLANVHRDPNLESETVTQALHGEPVRILMWGESWVKVSLPDQFDYQGWIQLSAIKSIATEKIGTNQKIVSVKNAQVLTLPNKDAPVFAVLPIGTVITSDNSENDDRFTSIQMVDKRKGYIASEQLLDYSPKDPADVSSDRILDTARQLLGQPYLWGGMTTDGVDCSGFIHTVFKVNGIRLHRDADLQYLYDGVKVDLEDLQPGDLVFFETYASGASHVGIYVGEQEFIHSTSKVGVSYASLDNVYFSDRFLGAKRILY